MVSTLPSEIIDEIMDCLDGQYRNMYLVQCCRVCRDWYLVARSHLYRRIVLSTEKLGWLCDHHWQIESTPYNLRTLFEKTGYSSMIHELVFEHPRTNRKLSSHDETFLQDQSFIPLIRFITYSSISSVVFYHLNWELERSDNDLFLFMVSLKALLQTPSLHRIAFVFMKISECYIRLLLEHSSPGIETMEFIDVKPTRLPLPKITRTAPKPQLRKLRLVNSFSSDGWEYALLAMLNEPESSPFDITNLTHLECGFRSEKGSEVSNLVPSRGKLDVVDPLPSILSSIKHTMQSLTLRFEICATGIGKMPLDALVSITHLTLAGVHEDNLTTVIEFLTHLPFQNQIRTLQINMTIKRPIVICDQIHNFDFTKCKPYLPDLEDVIMNGVGTRRVKQVIVYVEKRHPRRKDVMKAKQFFEEHMSRVYQHREMSIFVVEKPDYQWCAQERG